MEKPYNNKTKFRVLFIWFAKCYFAVFALLCVSLSLSLIHFPVSIKDFKDKKRSQFNAPLLSYSPSSRSRTASHFLSNVIRHFNYH